MHERYASLMRRAWRWIRVFFSNRNCLLCQMPSDQLLCPVCCEDLPRFDWQRCSGNLLLDAEIGRGIKQADFDFLVAFGPYTWPLDKLIVDLKFHGKSLHALALADLMYSSLSHRQEALPQLIIPVPLHPKRLVSRQYNQAALIAKRLNRRLGIPCGYDLLQRQKNTQAQSELTAAQRRANLKHAFCCTKPIPFDHVAIIDDVVTTGATASSVARYLKSIKPQMRVEVWCPCVTLERQSSPKDK